MLNRLGVDVMELQNAIRELRSRNESVPRPLRLPTTEEVENAQDRLGVRFHSDFRRYLLKASDVVFGTLEPVTITRPEAHTDLFKVARRAWDSCGVPRDLTPICEDNADYYCMNRMGEVVYWSHNGSTSECWPSLADWIMEVWLGDR